MTSYSTFSDQELARLLKSDDRLAFTEIFNRYSAPLFANAFNKLRNEDDAHDVVQDVLTKLWSRRSSIDPDNNLSGYLFAGVRNAFFDIIKHKKVIAAYEESFQSFDQQSYLITDYLIREKQFLELIEKEIASLPPRMREVFELRRKGNLSNKEIAARMQIAESTVADQMKKALKILRLKIGPILVLISLIGHIK